MENKKFGYFKDEETREKAFELHCLLEKTSKVLEALDETHILIEVDEAEEAYEILCDYFSEISNKAHHELFGKS